VDFGVRETFRECIQEGKTVYNITERTRFHDENFPGGPYCQSLSLRLVRNPSGFSSRMLSGPTSGDDINNIVFLIVVLVFAVIEYPVRCPC
jgi:hypothetical protein